MSEDFLSYLLRRKEERKEEWAPFQDRREHDLFKQLDVYMAVINCKCHDNPEVLQILIDMQELCDNYITESMKRRREND